MRVRVLRETSCATSAAEVVLCIISSSSSATLWMRNFLKPFFIMCLVFLLLPYPMLGIRIFPRKRRRTEESIPFGLLHDSPTRSNRSEKCLLKRLVRFFTIVGRHEGVGILLVSPCTLP